MRVFVRRLLSTTILYCSTILLSWAQTPASSLEEGLQVWLRFDELLEQKVTDASGHGMDGVVTGGNL